MVTPLTFGNHLKFGPDFRNDTKGRPASFRREREHSKLHTNTCAFTLRRAVQRGPVCVWAVAMTGDWTRARNIAAVFSAVIHRSRQSVDNGHKRKVVTRLSMIFLKVIFANGAIHLYTCLILQPIMPCCICFLYYVWYFPFWRKLMLDSSSNSSYMRSSFPNKFSHLKLSFFDLAFMPSLHVSLIKAVMRGSVVAHFLHNFQNVFFGYSYNLCQLHRWPY